MPSNRSPRFPFLAFGGSSSPRMPSKPGNSADQAEGSSYQRTVSSSTQNSMATTSSSTAFTSSASYDDSGDFTVSTPSTLVSAFGTPKDLQPHIAHLSGTSPSPSSARARSARAATAVDSPAASDYVSALSERTSALEGTDQVALTKVAGRMGGLGLLVGGLGYEPELDTPREGLEEVNGMSKPGRLSSTVSESWDDDFLFQVSSTDDLHSSNTVARSRSPANSTRRRSRRHQSSSYHTAPAGSPSSGAGSGSPSPSFRRRSAYGSGDSSEEDPEDWSSLPPVGGSNLDARPSTEHCQSTSTLTSGRSSAGGPHERADSRATLRWLASHGGVSVMGGGRGGTLRLRASAGDSPRSSSLAYAPPSDIAAPPSTLSTGSLAHQSSQGSFYTAQPGSVLSPPSTMAILPRTRQRRSGTMSSFTTSRSPTPGLTDSFPSSLDDAEYEDVEDTREWTLGSDLGVHPDWARDDVGADGDEDLTETETEAEGVDGVAGAHRRSSRRHDSARPISSKRKSEAKSRGASSAAPPVSPPSPPRVSSVASGKAVGDDGRDRNEEATMDLDLDWDKEMGFVDDDPTVNAGASRKPLVHGRHRRSASYDSSAEGRGEEETLRISSHAGVAASTAGAGPDSRTFSPSSSEYRLRHELGALERGLGGGREWSTPQVFPSPTLSTFAPLPGEGSSTRGSISRASVSSFLASGDDGMEYLSPFRPSDVRPGSRGEHEGDFDLERSYGYEQEYVGGQPLARPRKNSKRKKLKKKSGPEPPDEEVAAQGVPLLAVSSTSTAAASTTSQVGVGMGTASVSRSESLKRLSVQIDLKDLDRHRSAAPSSVSVSVASAAAAATAGLASSSPLRALSTLAAQSFGRVSAEDALSASGDASSSRRRSSSTLAHRSASGHVPGSGSVRAEEDPDRTVRQRAIGTNSSSGRTSSGMLSSSPPPCSPSKTRVPVPRLIPLSASTTTTAVSSTSRRSNNASRSASRDIVPTPSSFAETQPKYSFSSAEASGEEDGGRRTSIEGMLWARGARAAPVEVAMAIEGKEAAGSKEDLATNQDHLAPASTPNSLSSSPLERGWAALRSSAAVAFGHHGRDRRNSLVAAAAATGVPSASSAAYVNSSEAASRAQSPPRRSASRTARRASGVPESRPNTASTIAPGFEPAEPASSKKKKVKSKRFTIKSGANRMGRALPGADAGSAASRGSSRDVEFARDCQADEGRERVEGYGRGQAEEQGADVAGCGYEGSSGALSSLPPVRPPKSPQRGKLKLLAPSDFSPDRRGRGRSPRSDAQSQAPQVANIPPSPSKRSHHRTSTSISQGLSSLLGHRGFVQRKMKEKEQRQALEDAEVSDAGAQPMSTTDGFGGVIHHPFPTADGGWKRRSMASSGAEQCRSVTPTPSTSSPLPTTPPRISLRGEERRRKKTPVLGAKRTGSEIGYSNAATGADTELDEPLEHDATVRAFPAVAGLEPPLELARPSGLREDAATAHASKRRAKRSSQLVFVDTSAASSVGSSSVIGATPKARPHLRPRSSPNPSPPTESDLPLPPLSAPPWKTSMVEEGEAEQSERGLGHGSQRSSDLNSEGRARGRRQASQSISVEPSYSHSQAASRVSAGGKSSTGSNGSGSGLGLGRRNSLSDLKIPARISQAQSGIRQDVMYVREFARGIEDLKALLRTYSTLSVALRTESTFSLANGFALSSHRAHLLDRLDVEYGPWWEMADLLVDLGAGQHQGGNDSGGALGSPESTRERERSVSMVTPTASAAPSPDAKGHNVSPSNSSIAAGRLSIDSQGMPVEKAVPAWRASTGRKSLSDRQLEMLRGIISGPLPADGKASPALSMSQGTTTTPPHYGSNVTFDNQAVSLSYHRISTPAASTSALQLSSQTTPPPAVGRKTPQTRASPYSSPPSNGGDVNSAALPVTMSVDSIALTASSMAGSPKGKLRRASRAGLAGLKDLLKSLKLGTVDANAQPGSALSDADSVKSPTKLAFEGGVGDDFVPPRSSMDDAQRTLTPRTSQRVGVGSTTATLTSSAALDSPSTRTLQRTSSTSGSGILGSLGAPFSSSSILRKSSKSKMNAAMPPTRSRSRKGGSRHNSIVGAAASEPEDVILPAEENLDGSRSEWDSPANPSPCRRRRTSWIAAAVSADGPRRRLFSFGSSSGGGGGGGRSSTPADAERVASPTLTITPRRDQRAQETLAVEANRGVSIDSARPSLALLRSSSEVNPAMLRRVGIDGRPPVNGPAGNRTPEGMRRSVSATGSAGLSPTPSAKESAAAAASASLTRRLALSPEAIPSLLMYMRSTRERCDECVRILRELENASLAAAGRASASERDRQEEVEMMAR